MTENNELSEREIEILKLVATGVSNKEIAYQLKISPNTVKVHLKNIFAKIGVVSRTEAAMYAVKMGWAGEGGNAEKNEISSNLIINNSAYLKTPWYLSLISQPVNLLGILIILISGILLFIYIINVYEKDKRTPVVSQDQIIWEDIGKLPDSLKSMAYTSDGENIYIIGGETPAGVTNKMEIYNIQTNQIKFGEDKPTAVAEACAVLVGGKIYVGGGKLSDGTYSKVFEAYDINKNNWEKLEGIPIPLAGDGCITYEGRIYFFGGWDGKNVHSDIYAYTPTQNRWSNVGALSYGRAFFGFTLINNRIYVIGGWQGKEAIKSIEILEVDSDAIVSNSKLSLETARSHLASISVLDKIYVVGGQDHAGVIDNSLEYNPANGVWREINNPLKKEWTSFGLVNLGEYLYGFGGGLGDNLVNQVFRLRVLYTIVLPVIRQ